MTFWWNLGLLAVFLLLGGYVMAQTPATPPPAAAPAVAVPPAPTPNLTVASVKLEPGFLRTSKLLGMAVYNEQDKIGTIDDLFLKDGNQIVMAVVSVGGFLGIGTKLVAIPYAQLHLDSNDKERKLTLPGANKEALNAMPTFVYGD